MFQLAASNAKARHTHIAYTNDDGVGYTSKDKGHAHPITVIEVKPASSAPQVGPDVTPVSSGLPTEQPIPMAPAAPPTPEPEMPAEKRIVVGEVNGHTHELTLLVLKDVKEDIDDMPEAQEAEWATIVGDVHLMRKKAQAFDYESRHRAIESEDYYNNVQWEEIDTENLESTDRPALTANVTHSTILTLLGYQRNNRTDMMYFPVEGGDQVISDVLGVITKVVLQQCNFFQEESDGFEQACIGGLGCFNIYVDYGEDPDGKIIVEEIHRSKVLFGHHLKKDLRDCEYVIKETWVSQEKLVKQYPDKEDKIKNIIHDYQTIAVNSDPMVKNAGEDGGVYYRDIYENTDYAKGIIDVLNKNIKMIERWMKEYYTEYIFIDTESSAAPEKLEGWKQEDINRLKTIPDCRVVAASKHRMKVTRVAAHIFLEEFKSEYSWNGFPIVPLYAEKRGSKYFGKVEYVKSVQDNINKYLSVLADILNKMTTYGWFTDPDTFDTNEDRAAFEETATTPGAVWTVKNIDRPPVKVEGSKYPAEMERTVSMILGLFDRLMNVNTDFQGMKTSAESGLAQQERKKQALLGNEYLFDNLSLCKKLMGKILVHMIQDVFSPDRMMRILDNEYQRETFELAGKKYDAYDKAELKRILETADLTKYDVYVEESAQSPSTMYTQFLVLADLKKAGANIPDDVFIEMAPGIPSRIRAKIMEKVEAMQQALMESEQQTKDTEIIKSLIPALQKLLGEGSKSQGTPSVGGATPAIPTMPR